MKRTILYTVCLTMMAMFAATGCTNEDVSHCGPPGYWLPLKACDAYGEGVTNEFIKEVSLYVFDANGMFLKMYGNIDIDDKVYIERPANDEHLQIVGWANCQGEGSILPQLKVGDRIETAFVLLERTLDQSIVKSPDDVFYGSMDITAQNDKEVELILLRTTASVAITTRNLREYANLYNDDFRYILRKTGDKLDFYGNEAGEYVNYVPESSFVNKDFVTPIFNILPTSSHLEVDIYNGDQWIVTILKDENGNPLQVERGKLLNILIELDAQISVSVSITAWGEKHIWKDFN